MDQLIHQYDLISLLPKADKIQRRTSLNIIYLSSVKDLFNIYYYLFEIRIFIFSFINKYQIAAY